MKTIPSFDPSAKLSGDISVGAVDEGSSLLLYNLSIVNILLNFNDGNSAILHAGEANYWILNGSTATIAWSQYSLLNTPNPAISQVTGLIYAADEPVTGTYPMSFVNQVNIGGVVTTNTTSISNSGQTRGSPIILVIPPDNAAPTVSMDNVGNFSVYSDFGGVETQMFNIQGGIANPNAFIGNAGASIWITGTSIVISAPGGVVLQNNQPLQLDNLAGTSKTVLYASTTNDVNIQEMDSNTLYIRDNAGGIHTAFNNSAISGQLSCTTFNLLNAGAGTYKMHANGLSAIDSGTYTSATTATVHTHSLGGIPSGMMLCGGNTGGAAMYGSVDTFTSTTFKSIENLAGVAMRYLAWRF